MNTGRLNWLEHKLNGQSVRLQEIVDTLSVPQYRILIETEKEGVGIFDEDDVFLYANSRLCELLGVSSDGVIGCAVSDYLDPGSIISWRRQRRSGISGTEARFELVWARKDGNTVRTLVDPQGIFDDVGSYRGTIAVIAPLGEAEQVDRRPSSADSWHRPLFREILEAQELGRKRISKDLHDEVGQALTVIKLNVGLVTRNLPEGMHQLREECKDITSGIDHVIEHVRRLARELSPSILEDMGLGAALRALLHEFARGVGVKVTAAVGNVDHFIPKKAEIIVYRIIQEALANIARHARASNVTVIGGKEGPRLSFLVEDDGIGFDAGFVVKDGARRGLGLALIGERVRLLGGSLDLESEIGKGTMIRFIIPIDEGERR